MNWIVTIICIIGLIVNQSHGRLSTSDKSSSSSSSSSSPSPASSDEEKPIVVKEKDNIPNPTDPIVVKVNGNNPEPVKIIIGPSKSDTNGHSLSIVSPSSPSTSSSSLSPSSAQSSSSSSSSSSARTDRWAKLPIRPPKLRFGSKPVPTKTRRISYGSMVKSTAAGKKSDLIPLSYTNSSQVGGHDILEISSSEKRTSRMKIGPEQQYYQLGSHYYRHHHNPLDQLQKSASMRVLRIRNSGITGRDEEILTPSSVSTSQSQSSITSLIINNNDNSELSSSSITTNNNNGDTRLSTSRNIPKLLLPKFSRPAMYSLNGFIPKPNIQRLSSSTTSTSTTVRPPMSYRLNRKESARSYNLDKNNQRKYDVKHRQGLEDSDDLKISGSSNRLSKRKGYLSTSDTNKHGASKNQLINSSTRSVLSGRRGQPGKDFPTINTIPKTSFDCKEHIGGSGFYADHETGCQVWHMCQGHRKHSFLCPNGTIFNQKSGVCDWWYNVDCEEPVTLYRASESSTSLRQTRRSGSSSLFESILMDRKHSLFP